MYLIIRVLSRKVVVLTRPSWRRYFRLGCRIVCPSPRLFPPAESSSWSCQVLSISPRLSHLQILGDLVAKLGPSLRPFLGSLVPGLISKLGDSKIVVRHATYRVLRQLHETLGHQAVLSTMEEAYHRASSQRSKEEILQAVISMLPGGGGNEGDVLSVMRLLVGLVKKKDT